MAKTHFFGQKTYVFFTVKDLFTIEYYRKIFVGFFAKNYQKFLRGCVKSQICAAILDKQVQLGVPHSEIQVELD